MCLDVWTFIRGSAELESRVLRAPGGNRATRAIRLKSARNTHSNASASHNARERRTHDHESALPVLVFVHGRVLGEGGLRGRLLC